MAAGLAAILLAEIEVLIFWDFCAVIVGADKRVTNRADE
jgi:hypothetical protein